MASPLEAGLTNEPAFAGILVISSISFETHRLRTVSCFSSQTWHNMRLDSGFMILPGPSFSETTQTVAVLWPLVRW